MSLFSTRVVVDCHGEAARKQQVMSRDVHSVDFQR